VNLETADLLKRNGTTTMNTVAAESSSSEDVMEMKIGLIQRLNARQHAHSLISASLDMNMDLVKPAKRGISSTVQSTCVARLFMVVVMVTPIVSCHWRTVKQLVVLELQKQRNLRQNLQMSASCLQRQVHAKHTSPAGTMMLPVVHVLNLSMVAVMVIITGLIPEKNVRLCVPVLSQQLHQLRHCPQVEMHASCLQVRVHAKLTSAAGTMMLLVVHVLNLSMVAVMVMITGLIPEKNVRLYVQVLSQQLHQQQHCPLVKMSVP
jgi:hypothetical protein